MKDNRARADQPYHYRLKPQPVTSFKSLQEIVAENSRFIGDELLQTFDLALPRQRRENAPQAKTAKPAPETQKQP